LWTTTKLACGDHGNRDCSLQPSLVTLPSTDDKVESIHSPTASKKSRPSQIFLFLPPCPGRQGYAVEMLDLRVHAKIATMRYSRSAMSLPTKHVLKLKLPFSYSTVFNLTRYSHKLAMIAGRSDARLLSYAEKRLMTATALVRWLKDSNPTERRSFKKVLSCRRRLLIVESG
jgi:hypothetical protein